MAGDKNSKEKSPIQQVSPRNLPFSFDPKKLKDAVILKEILDLPVALR